jgi:hypothetical protein
MASVDIAHDACAYQRVEAKPVTVFRNMRLCALWMLLFAISIPTRQWWLSLYAFQALIAEGLGVRISNGVMSAPRRFWIRTPFVVLWRVEKRLNALQEIDTKDKRFDGEPVRLIWMDGGAPLAMVMSDRGERLKFFEAVRKFAPEARIFKTGNKRTSAHFLAPPGVPLVQIQAPAPPRPVSTTELHIKIDVGPNQTATVVVPDVRGN